MLKTAFGNNVMKETVLVPWDSFPFPLIKSVLWGIQFEDIAEIPLVVQLTIAEIPINSYRECFLSWIKFCRKCVD